MDNTVESIITRTRQRFYSDGLWELIAGGILLLGGLAILLSPQGNTGAIFFAAGVLVLFFLYSYLKNRLVYPRTGYALYKEQGLRARITTVIKRAFLLFLLSIIFIFLSDPNPLTGQTGLIFFLGVFIGVGWLWQGKRLGLTRLVLLGLIAVILGAVFSLGQILAPAAGKSTIEILGIYFLLVSVAFLLSGGITFVQYLRSDWQENGEAV
jgi:hypothetical protein